MLLIRLKWKAGSGEYFLVLFGSPEDKLSNTQVRL